MIDKFEAIVNDAFRRAEFEATMYEMYARLDENPNDLEAREWVEKFKWAVDKVMAMTKPHKGKIKTTFRY